MIHHLLAKLLHKKIGDQQFKDPYWKLVKAGYVEEGVKKIFIKNSSGWNSLSQTINVYLHEFDLFIEKLISIHHSTAKDITKKTNRNTINSHVESNTLETNYRKSKIEVRK